MIGARQAIQPASDRCRQRVAECIKTIKCLAKAAGRLARANRLGRMSVKDFGDAMAKVNNIGIDLDTESSGKARLERILTSNPAVAKELVLRLSRVPTGECTSLSIPSGEGKILSMNVKPLPSERGDV